jgi:O-antigen/teichoic acid export membrane protein
MILGVTQQVALVPVFLHFWTNDILAAWLVIYAVGNLVLIADCGLQVRAINRFLALKSSVDCDGRTAGFYAAMLRVYRALGGLLAILVLAGTLFCSPASVLGFQAIANFDVAFAVMTMGMLVTLPVNLGAGLYRARGLYGRAVRLQNWGMLIAQLGQLAAIIATGSLLAVTFVYVAAQVLVMVFLLTVDAPRLFPFLRGVNTRPSWSWIAGQFRKATPFAVAGAAELALLNLPVLLVSAFVVDRVAVAQWGLTRVAAGLLRALCVQTTLPLAAELGHDYALGLNEQLRNLYARASVFVTLLASAVVSGLLPFWPDFFSVWTRGAVPYDALLAMILLIGAAASAPSILAFNYANYSNRGHLLVRTKGLQLVVFLFLAIVLIRLMGPLGAAIAVVASDLLIQFGWLGVVIIRQTLQRPLRHVLFLMAMAIFVTAGGWALGTIIRIWVPGAGLVRLVGECVLWSIAVALIASPLAITGFRDRLIQAIPR